MNVRSWLREHDLEAYADAFAENGVDASLLPELSNDDLKDLGIGRLADRKRLLKAIEELSLDGENITEEKSFLASSVGERRQLTIFFADLTGYTELTDELDPEDLHGLIGHVFDAIDRIVEDHGGTVHRHVGDEVMALFGAPIAHSDDPMRAVRAALQSHKAMAALGDKLGRVLSVHIGIASGSVVIAEQGKENPQDVPQYAITGAAANLAARLNSLAEPGETIISDTVYRAVEAHVACDALGETKVKGFEKPVLTWSATALRTKEHKVPDSRLIGRRAETAQLNGALGSCRETGNGQAILVRGEAGMGKTRLVGAFEAYAGQNGFANHRSLILDFGVGDGQDAIRTLICSLLDISIESDIPRREVAAAKALSDGLCKADQQAFLNDLLNLPQPADLRGIYDAMDNATRRQGKHLLLSGLIAGLSESQPRLLVVEDVHWADGETLSDLARITAAVQENPVLLVMTSRIEGDPLDQTWRSSAGGSPLLTVDIGPLRKSEATELAAAFATAMDEFARNCIERAGGNPLFLEQLLRSAEESRDEGVPATIQSLVLARIDRLAGPDKQALQAASVIGQRFALETLQFLIDEPEYSCNQLIEHHLVRPDGDGFLFDHALIQESVYSSLLKKRRHILHLKAAELFAAKDPALKARHLDRGEDPMAPAAYLEAAKAQAAVHRYEQAAGLIERGLELASFVADRLALTCMKGKMQHDLGHIDNSIKAYDEALEMADSDLDRCRAWLGLAAGMRIADRYEEALDVLDKAEAVASANDMIAQSAEIHHIRGNIYFPMGRIEACAAEHEKSLKFATDSGSPEAEANALSGVADASYVAGRMATAFRYFSRCVEVAGENGFAGIEIANSSMVGFCRVYLNQLGVALEDASNTIAAASKVGHQRAEMLGQNLAMQVFCEMADYPKARQHNLRAMELARTLGAPRFEAQTLLYEGKICAAENRRVEAVNILRSGLRISGEIGHSFAGPRLMGALARSLADAKDKREALNEGERMLKAGSVSHNHFFFYPDAIEVSLDIGDWDEVMRYCDALQDFSKPEPLPWCDFFISRGQALTAWRRGQRGSQLTAEIERLRGEAGSAGIATALPALEEALATP